MDEMERTEGEGWWRRRMKRHSDDNKRRICGGKEREGLAVISGLEVEEWDCGQMGNLR